MTKPPKVETKAEAKLPLTSADLTADLLAQLHAAAPQIFSEGRVDFAKLQAALDKHIDGNPERYGLTWAGKRDAFRNVQIPSVATLRPQPEESVNWDSTENLIIEGDNLEVLKLLQKPYHAKVKMIYIDPPYNTGNEFIYPDNFREGLDEYLRYTGQLGEDGTATSTNKDTSGRYHSNWLNMMYPRLFLARNLLQEDGVIFVSIDDHEVHNLRLLMDEVFGEENFIVIFPWRKRTVKSDVPFGISQDFEWVISYAKGDFLAGKSRERTYYKTSDYEDSWRTSDLTKQTTKDERPNSFYSMVNPKNGRSYPANPKRVWSVSRENFEDYYKRGKIVFPGDYDFLNISGPIYRVFEKEDKEKNKKKFGDDIARSVVSTAFPKEIGMSQDGTKEATELLGTGVFSFPKPKSLLQYLVSFSTKSNDIILDFFAGSGTTAHAVLDLNQQDGGNRKFILVQLPEKTDNPQYPTIAHITRERVRRVIGKLQENRHSGAGRNPAIQGAFDLNPLDSGLRRNDDNLGFRAFKLDSSNFKIWNAGMSLTTSEHLTEQLKLHIDNVQANRDDQDRLYELILKSGLPLSAKVGNIKVGKHTAFAVADGNLLICLEPHLDRDTLRALFALKPQRVLCLDTAFDGNDALKTNTVLEAKTHGVIFKTV